MEYLIWSTYNVRIEGNLEKSQAWFKPAEVVQLRIRVPEILLFQLHLTLIKCRYDHLDHMSPTFHWWAVDLRIGFYLIPLPEERITWGK